MPGPQVCPIHFFSSLNNFQNWRKFFKNRTEGIVYIHIQIAPANVHPRSRKRGVHERARKKFIKKERVERGETHYTNSGRIVPAKIFDPQTICQCKNECALHIDVLRQQQIFDHYYYSSNWTEKTVFIRSNVSESEVKCRKSEKNPIIPLKKRLHNIKYSLSDGIGIRYTVCRKFFLKLLQISVCRIRNALSSEFRNPNAVDRRGKNPCYTKTKPIDLQFMKEFIGKFPCYESHYCRSSTNKKISRSFPQYCQDVSGVQYCV